MKEQRPGKPFSSRHRMPERSREVLDAILADDGLLDARRSVALSELLLAEIELVPSDARVEELAIQIAGADDHGSPMPVLPQHRERARLELVRPAMALVDRFSRQQVAAARQIEAGQALRDAVLPMIVEVGARMAAILDKYVPVDQRQQSREDLRSDLRAMMQRLLEQADAAG